MNVRTAACFALLGLVPCLPGCGGGGSDGGLRNKNPGDNDVDVVAAFGDSLTQGSECACTPYPERLAGLIGKHVVNVGVAGTMAVENVERTQAAIDRFRPGFMLILYGANDVIHGYGPTAISDALAQMLQICKDSHVVPVLATYPEPILDHAGFTAQILQLNVRIRSLASSQDVRCVDLEKEFGAEPELYQADGLHPSDAGTQIMAMAFADLF